MENRKVSFLTFFLMWAKVMGWTVPLLHVRICQWLEHCADPVRVLMIFRGAAKSTIYAVYKAWKLYCDKDRRSLIWAADGDLAKKLTRDTLNVLRRHPLCAGMLPPKPGAQQFWVNGAKDARNASMNAVGVNQNATGSRADDIDYDDVEVPKNIKTPEARANLRMKTEESTFIAVPGAQETYIGTPHTHDSIYPELVTGGAALLKIPLFESAKRYEDTSRALRYRFDFEPGVDGLYVIVGIHKQARLLVEGTDYRVEGREIVFASPPGAVLDIYGHCAWPERFTREDIEKRRKKTRTLNYWDSQYMLEAKPINECRLDPAKLRPYAVQPKIERANGEVRMMLGRQQIMSARAYWDCSLGKVNSDASALSVILDDASGNYYWHVAEAMLGEFAEFEDDRNGRITGGQVMQVCDIVERLQLPTIYVENNGVGAFTPQLLRKALKQRGLRCGVKPITRTGNKNELILDGIEGPLRSGVLWAHVDVLNGPLWDQMKDWNPDVKRQPDDFVDSGAGALLEAPVRIGQIVGNLDGNPSGRRDEDWRPRTGVHEVTLEY